MKQGRRDATKVQVKRGHTEVYVFDNNPFERVKSYRAAQKQANRADRGIWDDCKR